MKKRKKGGLITFLGISLLVLSPIFLITGAFYITIVLAIIGCILLFYGISFWKKSMHEMRVSHVALHAGKDEKIIDGEETTHDEIKTIEMAYTKIILLGLAIGFLGFILYQFLFSSGLSWYIRVYYLYADFLYLLIAGLFIGGISLYFFNYFGSSKKCFILGLFYEIPAVLLMIFGVGRYWNNIEFILTPLAFISFAIVGFIAGYIGGSITPETYVDKGKTLPVKNTIKRKCPSCYFLMSKESKFCPECGENMIKTCSSCNNKIPITAKFCPKCGFDFNIDKS